MYVWVGDTNTEPFIYLTDGSLGTLKYRRFVYGTRVSHRRDILPDECGRGGPVCCPPPPLPRTRYAAT